MSKTNGKRNRSAGNSWEREVAQILREIGFPHVVTTRAESRIRDAQKVDLINRDEFKNGRLPYNIQAKNVKGHIQYGKVLAEMPTDSDIINVIFHKQTVAHNGRFVTRDKFAILKMDDFLKLIQQRDARRPTKNLRKPNRKGVDKSSKGGNGKGKLPNISKQSQGGVQTVQSISSTTTSVQIPPTDTTKSS